MIQAKAKGSGTSWKDIVSTPGIRQTTMLLRQRHDEEDLPLFHQKDKGDLRRSAASIDHEVYDLRGRIIEEYEKSPTIEKIRNGLEVLVADVIEQSDFGIGIFDTRLGARELHDALRRAKPRFSFEWSRDSEIPFFFTTDQLFSVEIKSLMEGMKKSTDIYGQFQIVDALDVRMTDADRERSLVFVDLETGLRFVFYLRKYSPRID